MPDNTKSSIVAAALGWFREATPARKIQDVFVVAALAVVLGTSWAVWESKEAIVTAITTRDFRPPHLDTQRAVEHLPDLWASLKPLGCVAVQVFAVDMATNTIELVAVEGTSEQLLEAVHAVGRRTTFITASLTAESLRVASNMLQGDALFGTQPLRAHPGIEFPPHDALFVPLPDEPGRLLLGIVVCNWPIAARMDDAAVEVRTARLEVMEYAAKITD